MSRHAARFNIEHARPGSQTGFEQTDSSGVKGDQVVLSLQAWVLKLSVEVCRDVESPGTRHLGL